ncbi:hypothetical protein WH47_08333, partial [Habropoda laboriosa]
LRFAASILLVSIGATNGWPYHGIVGVGQSVYVAPVYGVAAPAVSLLPTEPVKEVRTVVAGPVTGTTIVEGSSSGPVTIVSPGTLTKIHETAQTTTTAAPPKIDVLEDSVLIKGATAGPVTLVAPSASSIAVADTENAVSARAETKKGVVAASASAEATVAIENAEESLEATANATTITETIGVASAKAVIGPSTGPIIIAGPTAPPIPVAVAATTAEPATVAASAATSSVSVASTAVANASVSSTVTVERTSDGSALLTDATESTRIEGSASSSSSAASASARVNLITPAIAVASAPLSNVVVSAAAAPPALVSGPSGTISAGTAASLLLKAPLYTL